MVDQSKEEEIHTERKLNGSIDKHELDVSPQIFQDDNLKEMDSILGKDSSEHN